MQCDKCGQKEGVLLTITLAPFAMQSPNGSIGVAPNSIQLVLGDNCRREFRKFMGQNVPTNAAIVAFFNDAVAEVPRSRVLPGLPVTREEEPIEEEGYYDSEIRMRVVRAQP